MHVLLALAVMHDPDCESLAPGAPLEGVALSHDLQRIHDCLVGLGWRSEVIHAGNGYVEQVLHRPVADAAGVAAALAEPFADDDGVQALQFNGISTDSFAVVDGADVIAELTAERARPVWQVLGMKECVAIDELIADDLLADGVSHEVARRLSEMAQRLTPDDRLTPGAPINEILFD